MIKVNEIDTTVSPAYAHVEITFGPQSTTTLPLEPTRSPSKEPTDVSLILQSVQFLCTGPDDEIKLFIVSLLLESNQVAHIETNSGEN